MGLLQGLHGKTDLVLRSVSKQYSPLAPNATTVSPQKRMHHEVSIS